MGHGDKGHVQPLTEVAKARMMPLEEVIQKAGATFTEPDCPPDRPDCYTINYLSVLDWESTDLSRAILPRIFDDSEKLKNLGEGIRNLLASYRFVEWVQASDAQDKPFVKAAIPILLGGSYLHRAKENLQKANAGNAMFGSLALIENELAGCARDSRDCISQREVLTELQSIILGYLFVFDQAYDDSRKEKEQKPIVSTANFVPEKNPEPLPVKSDPPKKGNRAPIVKITGEEMVPMKTRTLLMANALDPDHERLKYHWKQIGGPTATLVSKTDGPVLEVVTPEVRENANITFEVVVRDSFQKARAIHTFIVPSEPPTIETSEKPKLEIAFDPADRRIAMADLVRRTGGEARRVVNEAELNAFLSDILKPKNEKKFRHYQIMIIVDSSSSMQNSIDWLDGQMKTIESFAQSQLKEGGQVSLAVRHFVDNTYDDRGELVPLDTVEELERRKEESLKHPPDFLAKVFGSSEVKEAKKALQTIKKDLNGSIEYHWEAAMNAMDNEPWAAELPDKDPVGKIIFLITDEGDDGGINILNYTKEDVIAQALRKGIRFEHVLRGDGSSFNWNGNWEVGAFCFTGRTFLKKENGDLITFDEMVRLSHAGKPLPTIASWDEASAKVVYQTPPEVIEHTALSMHAHSTLLYLHVDDDPDHPLEVTPNHPMLIERKGERLWEKAGSLQNGDNLVNPLGGKHRFISSTAIKGAFDLYNLSFLSTSTGLHPTFLVSPDGRNWYVAHNKIM